MNRKSFLRSVAAVPVPAAAMLAALGTADAAPGAYTCTGGEVPSGTYSSLTGTGSCYVVGDVTVNGNVTVGPSSRAQFLVGYSEDEIAGPGRLVIKGSLTAKGASFVYLDCLFAGCVTVAGNVSVSQTTNYVLLDGAVVGGKVTVSGNNAQAVEVSAASAWSRPTAAEPDPPNAPTMETTCGVTMCATRRPHWRISASLLLHCCTALRSVWTRRMPS